MILGIVSDLHINFSGVTVPVDGIDALVVAGDISPVHEQTASWLERTVPPELPVILVLGNHDHEGFRVDRAPARLRAAVAHLPNVHVLHNSAVVVDGVRFLGTTLWTAFDAFEPVLPRLTAMREAEQCISDFSHVLAATSPGSPARRLSARDMLAEYRKAYEFLAAALIEPHAGPTIVVSHFLPSPRCCAPQFKHDSLNPYFATNVEELVRLADLWVHGHTHASINTLIEGTPVVCNPRGYSRTFGLAENQDWRPDFRVAVPAPR